MVNIQKIAVFSWEPNGSTTLILKLCHIFDEDETKTSLPYNTTLFSSVRSSNSHPDLPVTQQQHPLFQITPVLNTGLSLSERLQLYIKAITLYKGNHWTQCAGFMDASWVRLGITNDDLGTS